MLTQEPDLIQLFLDNCCRSSDVEFDDPRLEQLYSMTPQALLESGTKALLPDMIKYFNKMQIKSDLANGIDQKADLKRRIAAAMGKPVPGSGTMFCYFGVDDNGCLMFQPSDLAPMAFNMGNSVVIKLIPKLSKPAQKYSNDQGAEDYI